MIKAIIFLCSFTLIGLASAKEVNLDVNLDDYAASYFAAWTASQSPDATEQDLEHYLTFLADDIGHQHLPYDNDDTRNPNGKAQFREGMSYYLGSHTRYFAQLKEVTIGHNVIVITYATSSSGKHPQTGQIINQQFDTMEVLEMENGKVSVIRKYSE
ncbi:hypothetical protein TUM4438_24090 [Shewanella sairae]|uniref:Nuclear transport factor 2 family protein n=1 Tax=Shewanella sairae TaxID=190310 RepID=A0ABQ4PH57_9GAMM|nr:nuclear transport factor 2 family protein [Shewanella sairae]MCL1131219.1 nuclear transport factor 2 family protein [Shewanella sairae]GIU46890.1 hypothetical protein TUM4438_24090 [Shewanella sairae]